MKICSSLLYAISFAFSLMSSCSLHNEEYKNGEIDHYNCWRDVYGIPSYYSESYLLKIVNEINNAYSIGDGTIDSFIFITDTHFEKNQCHSGLLIQMIQDITPVRKVINGGDVGSVTLSTAIPSGFELLSENESRFIQYLVNKCSKGDFYSLRGNHGFNNRLDDSSFDGYDPSDVRRFYLTHMSQVVLNDMDSLGLYYFFDSPSARIRL